ncbi:mucin-21-like isoform X2 [Petaurus breviceps papuanus]|uniref:mucin-21-like isoform X2 n=1 Tax=Petaurus breviceps papuanus TaxID=3040969 RepID=UPI0036DF541B
MKEKSICGGSPRNPEAPEDYLEMNTEKFALTHWLLVLLLLGLLADGNSTSTPISSTTDFITIPPDTSSISISSSPASTISSTSIFSSSDPTMSSTPISSSPASTTSSTPISSFPASTISSTSISSSSDSTMSSTSISSSPTSTIVSPTSTMSSTSISSSPTSAMGSSASTTNSTTISSSPTSTVGTPSTASVTSTPYSTTSIPDSTTTATGSMVPTKDSSFRTGSPTTGRVSSTSSSTPSVTSAQNLKPWAIALISVAAVVGVVSAGVGFFYCFRNMLHLRNPVPTAVYHPHGPTFSLGHGVNGWNHGLRPRWGHNWFWRRPPATSAMMMSERHNGP